MNRSVLFYKRDRKDHSIGLTILLYRNKVKVNNGRRNLCQPQMSGLGLLELGTRRPAVFSGVLKYLKLTLFRPQPDQPVDKISISLTKY
jgi:hypothetical protein